MAAIYWRGNESAGSWWIKTYHPLTKALVRQSLETIEKPRAEVICARVELEIEWMRPDINDVVIPPRLVAALGMNHPGSRLPESPGDSLSPHLATDSQTLASPDVEEVLSEFLAYIQIENAPAHAKNKISYLKKFFGGDLMGLDDNTAGVFRGKTLADIKVADVRKLIDSLPVGKKTKKHHREAFHNLFEFAMKYSYFIPRNFRYPNPMSALPTYHEKNQRIIFLNKSEVDHLLKILEPFPKRASKK